MDHARRTSVRFKSPHKSNNACASQRFFTPLSHVFVRGDFMLLRNFLSRVFRFSGFKKEIAEHFFCPFVHFKLLYEFQS